MYIMSSLPFRSSRCSEVATSGVEVVDVDGKENGQIVAKHIVGCARARSLGTMLVLEWGVCSLDKHNSSSISSPHPFLKSEEVRKDFRVCLHDGTDTLCHL